MDAKAAGKGKVTCKVSAPDGTELDMDVVENSDGTFDIYYTAPEPGKYVITIRFGGQLIPNSPFNVVVSFSWPIAWGPYVWSRHTSNIGTDHSIGHLMSIHLPGMPCPKQCYL